MAVSVVVWVWRCGCELVRVSGRCPPLVLFTLFSEIWTFGLGQADWPVGPRRLPVLFSALGLQVLVSVTLGHLSSGPHVLVILQPSHLSPDLSHHHKDIKYSGPELAHGL